MSDSLWIEPQDVLYLRGNKLFGDPGDDALAQMPPWPSVAAGAIRSRMLVDHGINPSAFASGDARMPDNLATVLGTPQEPGSFHLVRFGLARRVQDRIEPLLPLPADVVVFKNSDDSLDILWLEPQPLADGIMGAVQTPWLPVLKTDKQRKPERGYWLNGEGIATYIAGKPLDQNDLIHADKLWKTDPRLGIALDADLATTEQGRIYTTDAIDLAANVAFVAVIEGAIGRLPLNGLLRFGGDGRAAEVRARPCPWPQADWQKIAEHHCFRLVLGSPGIFDDGWRLPGMKNDGRWYCGGGSARLVSAALSRSEVISGWDIAHHCPKPAQRVAPTGSIYWLDDWQGDVAELKNGVKHGLPCREKSRQAEGFNHCIIANWNSQEEVDASSEV